MTYTELNTKLLWPCKQYYTNGKIIIWLQGYFDCSYQRGFFALSHPRDIKAMYRLPGDAERFLNGQSKKGVLYMNAEKFVTEFKLCEWRFK